MKPVTRAIIIWWIGIFMIVAPTLILGESPRSLIVLGWVIGAVLIIISLALIDQHYKNKRKKKNEHT